MSVDLTRGYLLPHLDRVMGILQQCCPPVRFLADLSYTPEEVPEGWVRGGTTPSGQPLGDPETANWWIGDQYKDAGRAPWQIIWLPPLVGEERYVPGPGTGHHLEGDQDDGGDAATRQVPGMAAGIGVGYRKILSRIVPMRADLWVSDYPDGELLMHWLAASVHAAAPGIAEFCGEKTVVSGGLAAPLKAGQRGLRYSMLFTFVFPVIAAFETPGGSGDAVQGNPSAVTVRRGTFTLT